MESVQKQIPWHAQSAKDVLRSFEVTQLGLSESAIKERQKEFGKNELPQKPPKSGAIIFFSQFANPLIAILVLAAFISAVFGEWLDMGVIAFAVILNTILGFVEEYKADQSLYKLKSFLPEEVRVRRDGEMRVIESNAIVPGDIMILNTGDKVTADARLISSSYLEVSEAALTGESTPVKKSVVPVDVQTQVSDQTSMVFAGTAVVNGRAEMVVVQTGENTEIGHISKLVADVDDEKTPLQVELQRFAIWLGGFVLVMAVIVFVAGIIRDIEVIEMFKISIAVAVSAVPEGLVVATTVILAIGMQRILKKKALVRKLVAAETLGSVSVICMDKTGTLTTGEMSVVEMRLADGEILRGVEKLEIKKILGVTSSVVVDGTNNESKFSGSPTEIALAKEFWKDREALELDKYAELSELPFNSGTKFKAGAYRINDRSVLFTVGAPDVLFGRLNINDHERQKLQKVFEEMTRVGLRVLLVAKRDLDREEIELTNPQVTDLEVVGFIGLQDPLRETATTTVAEAKAAGLRPIMITGDHKFTAALIAKDVGLLAQDNQIISGDELDQLSDNEFAEKIESLTVYARVLPRHKLRIVRAWQDKGASVAMVGDGVNDAPAMKGADIGVALGSGTDVAKETADMVLLDNNFRTIVDAIREGRTIFDNIRKMIVYLVSDSFSEIILIFGAIIFGLPLPILPAQILWINLVTDGFPSIALTFEKAEKGVMNEPPRSKKAPIMDSEMKILIFLIGIFTDLLLFLIYFYLLDQNLHMEQIRTFIFVALGVDSLVYIFAVRKFRSTIFRSHPFENRWLLVGVLIGLLFLIAPVEISYLRNLFDFEPLLAWEWLALAGLAMVQLVLIEIVKEIYNFRRQRKFAQI